MPYDHSMNSNDIQNSNHSTSSEPSDFTSYKITDIPPFAQPFNAQSSPQSKLEIRTRIATPLLPLRLDRPQLTYSQSLPQPLRLPEAPSPSKAKPFDHIASKKRDFSEIIDLTIDDDGFEPSVPVQRKKSRSSSNSTESSIEARTKLKEPGIVNRTSPKLVLKFNAPRRSEKDRPSHSSRPQSASRKSTPTVLIPPLQPSPEECRRRFKQNLSVLGNVSVINTIDNTSPPLQFQFITESILRDGVQQVPKEFMVGCKCRPDNGRKMGCEYLSCQCLEDSVNSEGNKQFPYSMAKFNTACLRDGFIKGRNHIYECNDYCNCGKNCKNRVVQHGRKVGLEIFKTVNRGWGLRCMQDLKRGQFIDTYRGEIITHEEANRRDGTRTQDQEIYLMGLDKWTEDQGGSQYVCDGMHFGGPTRFINHSCDPNCAIYTVSYNHADINIYDLAFFATEPIQAGTELTFNYVDDDKTDIITEKKADEMQRENGYRPAKCLCGSVRCRGYFFT